MRKLLSIGLMVVMVLVLLAACGNNNNEAVNKPAADDTPDAITSASIVNTEEAFLNAISKDGTWIIATLGDMKIDKELVLEGAFTNKDVAARKIALYTQDEEHNITASFKLTAPKLTIKSENARIQGGTFVGDVYVEAKGFQLVKATVEGNVYFTNEEAKSTFNVSDAGVVTGVTELK